MKRPKYFSFYERGMEFEKEVSLFFHRGKIPLLISSQLLRSRGMGQLDCGWFKEGRIYLVECKYTYSLMGRSQGHRLRKTAFFISLLFSLPTEVFMVRKPEEFAKSTHSAYPFKVKKMMEFL